MNCLSATLKLDMRLQARARLYAIGIFVAVLIGLAGRLFVPLEYAGNVLAVCILGGIGGTTYMMSASLLLLEKSDGTLQALRTTPLTSTDYIASKVITLTGFATLESAIVYLVGFSEAPLNPALLLSGVVLLGVLFTLLGLGQAAPHDSVTGFLFPGAVVVTGLLQMPVIYLIAPDFFLAWLSPGQGGLLFLLAAAKPLPEGHWFYAIGMSLVSIALAFLWAKVRFAEFIGLQERQ